MDAFFVLSCFVFGDLEKPEGKIPVGSLGLARVGSGGDLGLVRVDREAPRLTCSVLP